MVARPFWIIGHNTNSLELVSTAVAQGVNALEIDVHEDAHGKWVVSHDEPGAGAPELGAFLRGVSQIAREHPRLCLVTLDCKTYNPATADALLDLARFNWADLSGGPFLRPFIISVPHVADGGLFKNIFGSLRELEGLMVDEDNDPVQVATFLRSVRNPCFGDGITPLLPGPHVRPAVEHATALKAQDQRIKFTYAWTFTQMSSLAEHVELGVDGIITDNVAGLLSLVNGRFASTVRLATSADNPFATNVPSYGLAVFTGSGASAQGTVTLTLRGDIATASKVVDASLAGRFDALGTTFVTLLGQEVGTPQSIAVSCAGTPWSLDSIQLLGLGAPRIATFDARITPGSAPVERALVP